MGTVMKKKGAGVTGITEMPPEMFCGGFNVRNKETGTTEDNCKVLSLVTKKLLMPLRDKEMEEEQVSRR